MWGTITNQLNNRIMAKKVYALYRTDEWHSKDSRDLLVVAGSIRRCGPSYGKDYIACDHYGGQWAIGVNFKDFTYQMRKFGEGKLAYNKEW